MRDTSSRSFKVGALARVEGEGGLTVRTRGGKVTDVRLTIFEPPRFFEGFLVGRRYYEAPDMTARICGICPIAYLLGASQAMEFALGIELTHDIRRLRRLIYCGEWIESHALHTHLLHAPDFMGYEDAIQMAKDHPEIVERGLRIKKIGNELMRVIGGREVHPINLRVGGFYSAPKLADLLGLIPDLEWALKASEDVVRDFAKLPIPEFERPYLFVAMRHPSEYPMCEGEVAASDGLVVPVSEYEDHYIEQQVVHSTALHSRRPDGRTYHVGPLARWALNYDRLSPRCRALAEEVGLPPVVRNPFQSILVRAVETVYAFEEALRLLSEYRSPEPPFVEAQVRAGRGFGITEAPRGICYHRYDIDADGLILAAKIVPPTSQNQPTIEQDLREFVPKYIDLPEEQLQWQCEQAVRNYDPCISCSVHFLRLRVDREDD